jgi:ubiquinone/menaquinone biosynthesis C-methylase UbiE
MARVSKSHICSLLACPRCRQSLEGDGVSPACVNESCELSREGHFLNVGDVPVLVDFQNSILDQELLLSAEGASEVPRRHNAVQRWVKDVLFRSRSLEVSQRNSEQLIELLSSTEGPKTVLVVGGGSLGMGVDQLYQQPDIQVMGFDVYRSETSDFIADAHQIPLPDASVDAVWIQYVLEHVLDPWAVVSEIHRVLKPGGYVYAETPFLQQVHEGAFDFTRFTLSGHRWLFRKFEQIDAGLSMGPGLQLLWTVEHASRGILRSRLLGKIVKSMMFWVRFVEAVIPRRFAIDNASATYFLGHKTGVELVARDMADYYEKAA